MQWAGKGFRIEPVVVQSFLKAVQLRCVSAETGCFEVCEMLIFLPSQFELCRMEVWLLRLQSGTSFVMFVDPHVSVCSWGAVSQLSCYTVQVDVQ